MDDEHVLTPDEVLDEVKKLLDTSMTLDEQNEIFENVMRGHRQQAHLTYLAAVRQKLDRTMKMLDLQTKVRDKLITDARLADLSTNEGIALYKLLSEEMAKNLEYVEKYVEQEPEEESGAGDVHFHLHGGAEQAATEQLESRDKIRRFIKGIMESAVYDALPAGEAVEVEVLVDQEAGDE